MNLIASVDKGWGIGCKNKLLVQIPDDLRFFREMTTGKVVVMGRKTRESIPGGILDGRVNIVLTHRLGYQARGAMVVHSLEELHQELLQYQTEDIFIAGGGSVYRQLLDMCDVAYITKLDFTYDADVYFPDLDQRPDWKIAARGDEQAYFDILYDFRKYVRVADPIIG